MTTTKTETENETTCVLCKGPGNRYRGKHLLCYICYADSVE